MHRLRTFILESDLPSTVITDPISSALTYFHVLSDVVGHSRACGKVDRDGQIREEEQVKFKIKELGKLT